MATARIPGDFHRLTQFMVLAALVAGAACDKKPSKPSEGPPPAGPSGSAAAGGSNTKPLAGIDVSRLEGDRLTLFYKLIGSLTSPCGKGHNLRVSFETDTACKRAPYAVRFVIAMLEDEVTEPKVIEQYAKRYAPTTPAAKLDLAKAPRVGNTDAVVRIVEFFDYACPHCYEYRHILREIADGNQGKVAEYFMMYPLGNPAWPHSKSAAMAAYAAYAQGKFKEMHDVLFEKGVVRPGVTPPHAEADVMRYAKDLGLDVAKFAVDYKAAAALVDADQAQGRGAGVGSTPTLFFNERKIDLEVFGESLPKYATLWIEEENAVNR